MAGTEFTIPTWVRSRTAKGGAIALVAFFIGMSAGGGGEEPTQATAFVAKPPTTVTVSGPAVTVDGPVQTVEVPGPTHTIVKTKEVRVTKTKTVRVTARAAEPAPFVGVPDEPADVYYDNCTEARDAGAAPLHRGDPGYGSHLDRDNDGVACES